MSAEFMNRSIRVKVEGKEKEHREGMNRPLEENENSSGSVDSMEHLEVL